MFRIPHPPPRATLSIPHSGNRRPVDYCPYFAHELLEAPYPSTAAPTVTPGGFLRGGERVLSVLRA